MVPASGPDDTKSRLTQPSAIPPPSSALPPPTGSVLTDTWNSATHVLYLPCSRNALMQGIMGGVGIGFIRGMTAPPIVAGHWAVMTFTGISCFSWFVCQRKLAQDRNRVAEMMERASKARKAKHETDSP